MTTEEGQQEQPPSTATPDISQLGYNEEPQSQAPPKQGRGEDGRPKMNQRRRNSNLPKRGLPNDRLSMRIPANFDALHAAEETHGGHHWKVELLGFIHSDRVQLALMVLLLLDVVILFIELFLQATYPTCEMIERDAISCCPLTSSNITEEHEASDPHYLRFLAESEHEDDHHNLCVAPSVESHEYAATCDPHKWSGVHTLEEVLFWCTLVILSIFMVELLALVIVLGKHFWCQFFYVLDLVIVATSLGLEIAFAVLHDEYLVALTGMLIFGRIWRFVRIGHGLIEVTSEYAAKDKKILLDYAELLETMLNDNNIDLPEKSKKVRHIEKHLTHHDSAKSHGGHSNHSDSSGSD